ncbi:hypothetical protein [Fibrivirga algicola]|uniref:Uncharacterized protein n=1 Tax=Fibrivirga algicola TaxID=2950420 RepID=A0ABX0QJ46_9BACT|nr:hypothetical protein [Fibrivirga algicola]NID11271.1 hypothetical protein [Fibrivirga algicola]
MRIIIELDDPKSPTVSTTDLAASSATLPATTGTAIDTVDAGGAPTNAANDEVTTSESSTLTADTAITVLDGGAAPTFPNP